MCNSTECLLSFFSNCVIESFPGMPCVCSSSIFAAPVLTRSPPYPTLSFLSAQAQPGTGKKTKMKAAESNMKKKKRNHVSASSLSSRPSDNMSLFPPSALRTMSQRWQRKRETQGSVAPRRTGKKPTTLSFVSLQGWQKNR